jgi:hypothetical protein
VSHQHLRESQALHLDYYKRKEKKMFHIKETCSGILARARAAIDLFAHLHQDGGVPNRGGTTRAGSAKLQKRPSNGLFHGA